MSAKACRRAASWALDRDDGIRAECETGSSSGASYAKSTGSRLDFGKDLRDFGSRCEAHELGIPDSAVDGCRLSRLAGLGHRLSIGRAP